MTAVLPDDIVLESGGRIVLVVMDGLGGLPHSGHGRTELEAASTPNLDGLARGAALGLHLPVDHGIAPGSGPGHLALFGYDPIRYDIGRGVLSALGVGFPLEPGDIAIRLNFATVDGSGRVTDRRAGRPPDSENRRLIEKLRAGVSAPPGVRAFFEPEKEHRAVLVLRGGGLSPEITDTDPQVEGVPPPESEPRSSAAGATAGLLNHLLAAAREVLSDEPAANALLARGIDAYQRVPSFRERFKLNALAIARYPMYSGVARLVGMTANPPSATDTESVVTLESQFSSYDYLFIHFKAIDSRGEDGDFDAKVAAIEAVDGLIARIAALEPDVLVVTGDHSTPALWRAHSWHAVPVLIASKWCRPSRDATFGERSCRAGELGVFPAVRIMSLALAHAGRLAKFGA
ncbi:MAG: 2,3-bisphosphoglycerate-independent phosphoglycerate mutase [Gemmatimonadetes bacterium]|nr:2,3-bisphosphoglycerate-independent phosphoglycerate mutase [Gemmatimonadota bacterium]